MVLYHGVRYWQVLGSGRGYLLALSPSYCKQYTVYSSTVLKLYYAVQYSQSSAGIPESPFHPARTQPQLQHCNRDRQAGTRQSPPLVLRSQPWPASRLLARADRVGLILDNIPRVSMLRGVQRGLLGLLGLLALLLGAIYSELRWTTSPGDRRTPWELVVRVQCARPGQCPKS